MDAAPENAVATPAAEAVNAFQAERERLAADLRELQGHVDARLAEVDAELARTDLKAAERTTAEATKTELEGRKTKVVDELAKVEGATLETWAGVKAEADQVGQDVKGWWDQLKDKVEGQEAPKVNNSGH